MIDGFRAMMDFGFGQVSESRALAYGIFLVVLAIVIAAWHLAALIYFRTTHAFTRWQLFITRVIHMCLLPFVLPVYACVAGRYLRDMLAGAMSPDGPDPAKSVLFCFVFLTGIALAFLFYIAYGLACNSPVLMYQALLCSWDPLPVHGMLAVQMWTCLSAPVLDLFAPWVTTFLIAVTVACIFFCVLRVRFFPFQRFTINVAFVGISIGNCAAQLMVIPAVYDANIPTIAFVIATLGFTSLSVIGAYWYLTRWRKHIVKSLSYSACDEGGAEARELEKRTYFQTLTFSSEEEMIAYLRVGLAETCENFLDFSFPHFILNSNPTPNLILQLQRCCVFSRQNYDFLVRVLDQFRILDISHYFNIS